MPAPTTERPRTVVVAQESVTAVVIFIDTYVSTIASQRNILCKRAFSVSCIARRPAFPWPTDIRRGRLAVHGSKQKRGLQTRGGVQVPTTEGNNNK